MACGYRRSLGRSVHDDQGIPTVLPIPGAFSSSVDSRFGPNPILPPTHRKRAMTATETMSDPASSLRALALSTLKAKRRKPAVVQPTIPVLSRLMPPPRTVSDAMQLNYGLYEVSAAEKLTPPCWIGPDHPFTREEGEISDEEGSPKRQKQVLVSSPPASVVDTAKSTPLSSSSPPAVSMPRGAGLSLLDRITDAPSILPSMAERSQPLSERISSPATSTTNLRAINDHRVRPNLHLNQSQYDTAKDIVLDLLGWGVSPEYLVDCGLSRELIYYVFTELNLRMPDNLSTTGLLPYNPDTIKTFIEADLSFREEIKKTSTPHGNVLIPPILPPSLSQRDLNGIEKLRRQELIARKAVQASRRPRTTHVINSANIQIPSETVDDFLKTITPSDSIVAKPSTDMNIDEPHSTDEVNELLLPHEISLNAQPPPSSTDSMTMTFNSAMRLSPENNLPVLQHPARRGVKRPVASDFVDVETNIRNIDRSNSHDTTVYQPIRRKTGTTSFVNVRPTKCVIDLSDSEADEDDTPSAPTSRDTVLSNTSNAQSKLQAPSKSPPLAGSVTPATLEETEKEIQRMREWIAQREQRKTMKKLGPSSMGLNGKSGFSGQGAPIPSPEPSRETSNASDPSTTNLHQDTSPVTHSKAEPVVSADQQPHLVSQLVDVDGKMSSSAQIVETSPSSQSVSPETETQDGGMATEARHNLIHLDSLFAEYPLLRLSLPSSLAGEPFAWKDPTSMPESVLLPSLSLPDLKPLREANFMKQIDPNKFLCQYEIPGGGSCRDASCEDIHLSKLNDLELTAEPNDHDTAKYLSNVLSGLSFDLILVKLQQVRVNNPAASLEDRVSQAFRPQQSSLQELPPTT